MPKALSIVGADPQLGALVPNTIAMHDDGEGAIRRPATASATYVAAFAPAKTISYVYTEQRRAGEWEGLDVPHIRR